MKFAPIPIAVILIIMSALGAIAFMIERSARQECNTKGGVLILSREFGSACIRPPVEFLP